MLQSNPHRAWLKELRRLRVRIGDGLSDDYPGTVPRLKKETSVLQERIITTDPTGKEGVLAQIDLLQDLAWSDPVRRLTSKLSQTIRRLWPD